MEKLLSDNEVSLVLQDIHDLYGYDFSEYAKASLLRRMNRLFQIDKFTSFAEFRYRIRSDKDYLKRFVEEITVNVTEMFRDPHFFKLLRNDVLPVLSTYPLIRIWHAGCSSGEEVYSMAIWLKEQNLLHKSLLYATDLNPDVLQSASKGMFALSKMKSYSENYLEAGGQAEFSSYYTAKYDKAVFDKSLREKIVFATHNLVSDRSFNSFQLILCRNVMIYFEKELQDKVLTLFNDSLDPLGFLALGSKETIRFSPVASSFTVFDYKAKVWRKRT